jgi:hypothetical protein
VRTQALRVRMRCCNPEGPSPDGPELARMFRLRLPGTRTQALRVRMRCCDPEGPSPDGPELAIMFSVASYGL